MRESPRLWDSEITEAVKGDWWEISFDAMFRPIADKATDEALRWVVEDLREKADILFKAANNEDISYSVRGDKILVCNHLKLLADDYEAKLKEAQ